MEIDEIEIRRDTSTKLKRTPMTKKYKPTNTIEHRSIEKDLYKLFSGTDSLVLQVLDLSSDASEDEAEAEIPTLSDAVSSCLLSEGKSLASYLQTVYSDDITSKIEELTRGKSDNNAWFEHRKEFPFMGATPDGVVSYRCCCKGLLEIKCSFMHQNETPLDACLDSHYHVSKDENNCLRLKESSSWHTQIQGQMGICKRQWCDFVFFSSQRKVLQLTELFLKKINTDIVVKCE
ncbi:Hypothetical predicted protein [Mytilus galloprovincialis]|uniref:YqaJ viral recombinase domain-containing protein n=1 Tax=Mytilus galloprovincialis TaxID=29158 RepID=A0A8B6GUN5_MYTGA|nr:Hypothetical predicted protein [Mytilus galloprovincialis]